MAMNDQYLQNLVDYHGDQQQNDHQPQFNGLHVDDSLDQADGHPRETLATTVFYVDTTPVGIFIRDLRSELVPRKRVVLDIDTESREIKAHIKIRNKASEIVAFKNESSLPEGYTITPDRGVLLPGEMVDVTLLVKESFKPERDFETDQCTLAIATYNPRQTDHIDAFLTSPQTIENAEKHIMTTAISPAAKQQLTAKAADQEMKKAEEDYWGRVKRIAYPTVAGLGVLISMYATFIGHCPNAVSASSGTPPSPFES